MEQRKYVRVRPPADRPLEVTIDGWDAIGSFRVLDISYNGVRIDGPESIKGTPVDAEVILRLRLPQGDWFRIEARIRHKVDEDERCVFGAQFQKMETGAAQQLEEYVSGVVARDALKG